MSTATQATEFAPTAANDNDDVLDVPGAMALLKVGRSTLYAMCGANQVPHRRCGRQIRFSRAALVRWLDSHQTSPE